MLARGYFRRPELTAEKFVADRFMSELAGGSTRPGDLVRRLADGRIEWLGRLDHQVKIRGFRIELGEIESVLAAHPSVREAAVLAREDAPGDKRLVAYFTAAEDIAAGALRAHMERALPEYMAPTAYVRLGALPLTPNGKLDRRALPAPGDQAFGTRPYEAPKGPIETAIAATWAEFLHLERIGRHDDFFDLGGHSLMALRVIGAINTALRTHLHVPTFFQNPTIERLAKAVEQKHKVGNKPQVVQLQSGHTGLPVYIHWRPARRISAGAIARRGSRHLCDRCADAGGMARRHRSRRIEPALPTIEQLGALYGDVLRAHAGSSPCVIAGYSLGGKIAFEAAHALRRAGGNVRLVLLVDAWAFTWSGATRGPVWQSLRWIWRGAASRMGQRLALTWPD